MIFSTFPASRTVEYETLYLKITQKNTHNYVVGELGFEPRPVGLTCRQAFNEIRDELFAIISRKLLVLRPAHSNNLPSSSLKKSISALIRGNNPRIDVVLFSVNLEVDLAIKECEVKRVGRFLKLLDEL